MDKLELLLDQMASKQSCLCVGLDTDPNKLPESLSYADDAAFEFNRRIVEATLPYAVAFKLNTAFYEAQGIQGLQSLEKTLNFIKSLNAPILVIADAKRGDIGNTAKAYAQAWLQHWPFDALTVSPYMGMDTLQPFLEMEDKFTIALGLTSNPGAENIQERLLKDGTPLYLEVLRQLAEQAGPDKLMMVVGATRPAAFLEIRRIIPDHVLLVPGIGAQGGKVEDVMRAEQPGRTPRVLINASRSIMHAGMEQDFDQKAAEAAYRLQQKMARFM